MRRAGVKGRSGIRKAVLGLVIVLCGSFASGQTVDPPSKIFVEGEDLIYNVSYGIFDLGQVRIRTYNGVRTPTFVGYEGKAYIDSYPKVPFVDLHAIYESLIDSSVFSRHFIGRTKRDNHWDMSRYTFEYDKDRVLIDLGQDSSVAKRETLSVATPYHDGLTLFFFARDKLFSGQKINIPTLITEQKVTTFIDFKRDRTSVEVDAINYPVDVIGFEGFADFVGIFGLTGGFEGWFSNDEARIPIKAKMKVIIGSVTIELMKWNRPGWTPPHANG
jgi:hypothetical protein